MNQSFSPPNEEAFKAMLRARGMKATAQRLAVHRAMIALGHASADMVADHVAANTDTGLTVSSVYNSLSNMARLGIYKRIPSTNNKMYFDVNTSWHAHLYDTDRNEYFDLTDLDLAHDLEEKLKKHRFKGYKVDAVEVSLLCHQSRKKRTKNQ